MIELVTAATFGLLVCVVWLIARAVYQLQHDPIKTRLAAGGVSSSGLGMGTSTGEQFIRGLAAQLPQTPFENGELDRDLRRAGYYKPNAKQQFLAFRNGLILLAVVLTGIAAVLVGPQREDLVIQIIGGGAILVFVAWGVPRVLVAVKAKQRVQRVQRALPDALDMMCMCLHGGLSLEEVLGHVSRAMFSSQYDLAVELLIIRQQAQMNSLEFAFRQFAKRIDGPEMTSLATIVSQNQRLGTNVADAVRDYAESMRLKRRQLAEERSGRVQLAMLFPVVLCLLPAVLILLWGPAVIELWTFLQGFDVGSAG